MHFMAIILFSALRKNGIPTLGYSSVQILFHLVFVFLSFFPRKKCKWGGRDRFYRSFVHCGGILASANLFYKRFGLVTFCSFFVESIFPREKVFGEFVRFLSGTAEVGLSPSFRLLESFFPLKPPEGKKERIERDVKTWNFNKYGGGRKKGGRMR